METATLDPAAETKPEDAPATPEPDGPNQPQDDPGSAPQPGDDPPPADTQDSGDELHVEGDEGYLTTDFGGKAPTDSKLQITGKAITVEGQFQKGQRITAMVELVIGGGGVRDKTDSATGQVVACTRTHEARIVGFARKH